MRAGPFEADPVCCGRCYTVAAIFPATCNERPESRSGPLGMYHCPDCGAMVLAGSPHPDLCQLCNERRHPFYDEGA